MTEDQVAKLLLLNDDEAGFLAEALELWVTIHAGEDSPDMDANRVHRFQVARKLEGKYTDAERHEIGTVALGMMM